MMKKLIRLFWGILTFAGLAGMFLLFAALETDMLDAVYGWFYGMPLISITFFSGLKADLYEF